jgi:iron complex transport system substrate-binding protein
MSGSARVLLLVLGVVTALGLAGCSSSTGSPASGSPGPATATLTELDPTPIVAHADPALPVTVRGFDGAGVTVSDADRIVAVDLYGTLAETVYALGLGDRLVGRGSSAAFPAVKRLPDVTPGGTSMNVEAVLALHPTVLLADSSAGSAAVIGQLRAAGVPVVMLDPARTVAGVGAQIESVADALGVHNQGVALARRSMAEIDRAVAGIPAGDRKLKIAFLYLRGASITMLAGPGSGADSLIEALGAADVGTTAGLTAQFTPITSEAMVAAAPDALLVMTDGLASLGGVPGLLRLPGVAQTPAGRDRRVVDMADSVLLSFGPNTGHVLAALRTAIYGPTGGTPATATR